MMRDTAGEPPNESPKEGSEAASSGLGSSDVGSDELQFLHRVALGGAAPSAARAPAAGSMILHYEVIRPLGRGGMGAVYLARDTRLGRLVAIKLLLEHSGERAERFLAEARTTAQLTHESIVVIHELGEHAGAPFMVLEYVRGKTLREWLGERRERARQEANVKAGALADLEGIGISPGQAIEIMIPIAQALERAHEHGVVHRDLKPSNVMLTEEGAIKVLDFGVAKIIDDRSAEDGGPGALHEAPLDAAALTRSRALVGTLPYMAPEQLRREVIDARADIWAAGLILAELLLGRHLLGSITADVLEKVRDLDVPMPSLRERAPELGRLGWVVDRCLRKRREDRLGSARELLDELSAASSGARRPLFDEETSPYPGLSPFHEGDAARFFGRSRMVTEVAARLEESPLIAVVGPSGAGKSSFVRAGVIPALARAGDAWEALVIRPGSRPLLALAELLFAHTSSESVEPAPDRDALAERLRVEPGFFGSALRARARRKLERVLLFVDQLEEVYTLAPEDERAAFFACVAGAADDRGSPLRMVAAVRLDFLDRVSEAEAALIGLHRGIVLLPPMDREGLREALIGPLAAASLRFEPPELVDEMLDTLEHTSIALPLLSFTAAKLWEQRDRGARALTAESYRRMGGLAGTLAGHAEAVLSAMSPEDRRLVRAALLRLVTPERTRAPAALSELCTLAAAPATMERILGRLIDARLLAVDTGDARATVELVHESLIASWPTLARWVAESHEDAVVVQRLRSAAREWRASGLSEDLLWRGQTAEEAKRWRARYAGELSPEEARFLAAVVALEERARRWRRRAFAGALAALTAIVVVVSYLALSARRELARAEIEARRARNATRMAAARAQDGDPTTALALLREIEPPDVPEGWSDLARWVLQRPVARTVLSHPDCVSMATFSPDGRRIVAASCDNLVRVWSADGVGEPVVINGGHRAGQNAGIFSVAVSPDGERVVTAAEDSTARVWRMDGAGEPIILRGHQATVTRAAFSPDGRRIVTASQDNTVRVWSADGLGEPVVLRGHEDHVVTAAFSPDGERIVSGSRDKTARLWNADGTGEPLILRGHDGWVVWAAFRAGGDRVITASADRTVREWSAKGAGAPLVVRRYADEISQVDVSPDGARIVSSSTDGVVRVRSVHSASEPLILGGHQAWVSSVAFGPDGESVVTASDDMTVRVWSMNGGGRPVVLQGHDSWTNSVAFTPDGKRVVTASWDKTARVWNADGSGEPIILRGHEDAVTSAAVSPDGRHILTASWDKTARVWSADGVGEPLVLRGHEDRVYSATYSPDGERIVTSSRDKTIRVWRADGAGEPVILRGHAIGAGWASFSPDGERIVSASADATTRIWRADGAGEPVILRGRDILFNSAVFSPDGARVVTASHDKIVRVWNADGTGEPLLLRGHENRVNWAAFSPDGERIVSASQDKTVRVWRADGSGEPMVLRGAADAYNRAVWSPDGKNIAAVSDDKTAWVWTDLEPIRGVDDARLWAATAYCIPSERRMAILNETEAAAEVNHDACARRTEGARAAAHTLR